MSVSQVLDSWYSRDGTASNGEPWLMIWDDMSEPEAAEEDLPSEADPTRRLAQELETLQKLVATIRSRHGVLMVTTQSQSAVAAFSKNIPVVEVCSFQRDESLRLVRHRRPDVLDGPRSAGLIDSLLSSLEDVPLAITHTIGAFQKLSGQQVSDLAYIILQEEVCDNEDISTELRIIGRTLPWPRSAFRAWNVVFQLSLRRERQTLDLLSTMSFLDAQHIPISFLTFCSRPMTNIISSVAILLQYSVVVVEDEIGFLSMQPLIQAFVRAWLKQSDTYHTIAQKTLCSMLSAISADNFGDLNASKQFIPHAKTILQHNLKFEKNTDCADLMHQIAWFEWQLGHFEEAYKFAQGSLDARRALLGDESESTLISFNLVALLLRCLGRHDAAYEINRQNLSAYDRILGSDHPSTLMSRNNLSLVLRAQGKEEEAECVSRETLQLCERVLGASHMCTSTAVANMALVLADQGKLNEAEEMSRRALAIREKALNPEHQSTLTSYYCLAHVLHRRKQYSEASLLYQKAYHGFLLTLGISHSLTLACEAGMETLKEEVLSVSERDHPRNSRQH